VNQRAFSSMTDMELREIVAHAYNSGGTDPYAYGNGKGAADEIKRRKLIPRDSQPGVN
jgi:hypothetical protein